MQKVAKNKNEKTNIEHVSFIATIEMYDCSLRRLGEESSTRGLEDFA